MPIVELANIDDCLYNALLARAAKDNRSVSQEVLAILQERLAQPSQEAKIANEAFMELVGSWPDE